MKRGVVKAIFCFLCLPIAFAQAAVECKDALSKEAVLPGLFTVVNFAIESMAAQRNGSRKQQVRDVRPQIVSMSEAVRLEDGTVLYKFFLRDASFNVTQFIELIVEIDGQGILTYFIPPKLRSFYYRAENSRAMKIAVNEYNRSFGGGAFLENSLLVDKITMPDKRKIFIVNVDRDKGRGKDHGTEAFIRFSVRVVISMAANGVVESISSSKQMPFNLTDEQAVEIARTMLVLPKNSGLSLNNITIASPDGSQSWHFILPDIGFSRPKIYSLIRSNDGFFDIRGLSPGL